MKKSINSKLLEKRKHIATNLLKWRKRNNLDSRYPWRNSSDPYKVLTAEILLKKTAREQVAKEWKAFIKNFPDFKSLNSARLAKLERILRPLGLEHTRATQLKKLAKYILKKHSGRIPKSKEDLLKLPGVGPYTANAVLCFAFHKDVSMLDTNIIRVLQRVFSLESSSTRTRTDKKMWEFAEGLPPKGKGKEFNYALLDFARNVCTPRKPKCSTCVMNRICNYYKQSMTR